MAFACRLNALSPEQRQRQQALLLLAQGAQTKSAVPGGVTLAFPATAVTFRDLAEWISLERLCCPFLSFGLDWGEDDRLVVRVTGAPGTMEFLDQGMGLRADP